MDAGNARPGLRHALAGLQAGVAGAVVMIVWLMLASKWSGRSVWTVPNLFATLFYGNGAYRNSFARGSWAGAALITVIYGLAGAVWGLAVREARPRFLGLIGVLAGLLVYVLFFRLFWPHAAPLVALYAPERPLEFGHLLWGLALRKAPLYARRIAIATGSQAAGEPNAGEPSSGAASV